MEMYSRNNGVAVEYGIRFRSPVNGILEKHFPDKIISAYGPVHVHESFCTDHPEFGFEFTTTQQQKIE
jgi:hypothetical protein